jgi:hypothetical protein
LLCALIYIKENVGKESVDVNYSSVELRWKCVASNSIVIIYYGTVKEMTCYFCVCNVDFFYLSGTSLMITARKGPQLTTFYKNY